MKLRFAILLAFFVAASAAPASADLVYDILLSAPVANGPGTATITGQIATDGATGILVASDITAWSLTISGSGSNDQ